MSINRTRLQRWGQVAVLNLSLLVLVACSGIGSRQHEGVVALVNDPVLAQEQDWFLSYYEADTYNKRVQPAKDYFKWLTRFYRGMNMVPGWLQMTEQVVMEVPPEEQALVAERLDQLGRQISAEWAKDNSVRRIDSRMVNIWRQALSEAIEQDDVLDFLERVEQDVSELVNQQLDETDIDFERYYEDDLAFF